jgi:hypothetical protein
MGSEFIFYVVEMPLSLTQPSELCNNRFSEHSIHDKILSKTKHKKEILYYSFLPLFM